MAESIVSDWIGDYNALEPQEIKSFAALHAENHELSTAIHSVLNDKPKHQEVKKFNALIYDYILIVSLLLSTRSIYIRFAINCTTSIDRTKMSSNVSHYNSFRI
jgi:hypothetical protein